MLKYLNIKSLRTGTALAALLILGGSVSASATPDTDFYFRTTAPSFSPGSEFTVGVFVNSGRPVNAFDVEVGYSVQSLELVSTNSADSIIGLWKDSPETLAAGIVRIRGAVLPAFAGTAGELLKLNFRVRQDARPTGNGQAMGTLQWSFRHADAYVSDGKGTLATGTSSPLIIPIAAGASVSLSTTTDSMPPLFLSVRAAKNPVDGSFFAVWTARDDDSGIHDTMLRTRRFLFWEPWESAMNPVRLPEGTWSFELKVTDNHGNSDYRTVYLWPAAVVKLIEVLVVLVLVGVGYVVLHRRRGRRHAA